MKKTSKKPKCEAQIAWKEARSDERWEIRADYLMGFFSRPSIMLPSQISHLKSNSEKKTCSTSDIIS